MCAVASLVNQEVDDEDIDYKVGLTPRCKCNEVIKSCQVESKIVHHAEVSGRAWAFKVCQAESRTIRMNHGEA